MAKKWYRYFVVTDERGTDAPAGAGAPRETTPRRVSDVAAEATAEPVLEAPAAGPVDLADVYESARIPVPAHGYTVLKVAEMLGSEHLQSLEPDVKRKSILVALDAAGVSVTEIVEDAVRRDRALDTFERVLEKRLNDLRAEVEAENRRLEEEIARRVAELRAQVDANRSRVEQEAREFHAWRARKQQEEAAIAAAIGHFVSENPITVTRD